MMMLLGATHMVPTAHIRSPLQLWHIPTLRGISSYWQQHLAPWQQRKLWSSKMTAQQQRSGIANCGNNLHLETVLPICVLKADEHSKLQLLSISLTSATGELANEDILGPMMFCQMEDAQARKTKLPVHYCILPQNGVTMYVQYLFINWFRKRHKVVTFRGAVSSQRWPKPAPVLAAPTHGGMARLSGLEWCGYIPGR